MGTASSDANDNALHVRKNKGKSSHKPNDVRANWTDDEKKTEIEVLIQLQSIFLTKNTQNMHIHRLRASII